MCQNLFELIDISSSWKCTLEWVKEFVRVHCQASSGASYLEIVVASRERSKTTTLYSNTVKADFWEQLDTKFEIAGVFES